MPVFAIVDSETGEYEYGCPDCYILSVSGGDDKEEIEQFRTSQSIAEGHSLIELTSDELPELRRINFIVSRNNEEIVLEDMKELTLEEQDTAERFHPNKLDKSTMTPKLDDRPRILIPIETDGIGGKEIIGFEEKPESIIIKRIDPIIKADSKPAK